MSWNNLKNAIHGAIRENNNQEITGLVLQNTLDSIVNNVGANATFAGVATPNTSPGTPDGPVFYIVGQEGQYSNFGNQTITIETGTIGVFSWDGSAWSYTPITVIAPTDISDIEEEAFRSVTISEIDNLKAGELRAGADKSKYVVFDNNQVRKKVGILHILSDVSGHVVTQILFTHYVLSDDGTLDTSIHSDTEVICIFRSIKIKGGTLPSDEWTKWKYINSEAIPTIPLATTKVDGLMSAADKAMLSDIEQTKPSLNSNKLISSGAVYNAISKIAREGYVFKGIAPQSAPPLNMAESEFYLVLPGLYKGYYGVNLSEDGTLQEDCLGLILSTAGTTRQYVNLVSFTTEITYSELKSLRDSGNLIPGMQYRITDYQCTTTQIDTDAANHRFDILVQADSNNKLSENASAIQHKGDSYFANAKLEAWELKYCIDNDTTRFAWASEEDGTGVIYYMKDEWGNCCPYDFKNIRFARCYVNPYEEKGLYLGIPYSDVGSDDEELPGQRHDDIIMAYTFSCFLSSQEDSENVPFQVDASMGLFNPDLTFITDVDDDIIMSYGTKTIPHNNVIEAYFARVAADDIYIQTAQALNNITFCQGFEDDLLYDVSGNYFGADCHHVSCRAKTFKNNHMVGLIYNCYFIGKECTNNMFSGTCTNSVFLSTIGRNNVSGEIDLTNIFHECLDTTISGSVIGCYVDSDIAYCTLSGDILDSYFSGTFYNTAVTGTIQNCNFRNIYHSVFTGNIMTFYTKANIRNCEFRGELQDIKITELDGGYLRNLIVGGSIMKGESTEVELRCADYEQRITLDRDGNIVVEPVV